MRAKEPCRKFTKILFVNIPQTGNIAIRILIVLITLLLIAGTIVFTLSQSKENQQIYHRKVMAISEYGLLMALEKLHEEPSWKGNIERTPYDGGWYKIKTMRAMNADTLFVTIECEGHLKSAFDCKRCVLTLSVIDGDSIWVRRSIQ